MVVLDLDDDESLSAVTSVGRAELISVGAAGSERASSTNWSREVLMDEFSMEHRGAAANAGTESNAAGDDGRIVGSDRVDSS